MTLTDTPIALESRELLFSPRVRELCLIRCIPVCAAKLYVKSTKMFRLKIDARNQICPRAILSLPLLDRMPPTSTPFYAR